MVLSAFGHRSTHVGIRSASSSFFEFSEIVGGMVDMETLTLRMRLSLSVAKSLLRFIGSDEPFELWIGDPKSDEWVELELDTPKQVHLLSEGDSAPMEAIILCRVAEHQVHRADSVKPGRFRYRVSPDGVEIGRSLYIGQTRVEVDGVLLSYVEGMAKGITAFFPVQDPVLRVVEMIGDHTPEVRFVMENRIGQYTFSRVATIDRGVVGPSSGRPRHILIGADRGRRCIQIDPADDGRMTFDEVIDVQTDVLIERITGRPVAAIREAARSTWEW